MKKLLMTAVTAAAFVAGAASAATLSLTPGTYGVIPGGNPQLGSPNNDVLDRLLGAPAELGGYFGSNVLISEGAKLRVEVFGWEATHDNVFSMGGVEAGAPQDFKNNSNADGDRTVLAADLNSPLQEYTVSVTPGAGNLLEFSFRSLVANFNGTAYSVFSSVANGSNPDGAPGNAGVGQANVFASFGPGKEAAKSGKSLWLFFDDVGQEGDNHDDLVIRISVVPLPAGGLLLLTGLGALALRRRNA